MGVFKIQTQELRTRTSPIPQRQEYRQQFLWKYFWDGNDDLECKWEEALIGLFDLVLAEMLNQSQFNLVEPKLLRP